MARETTWKMNKWDYLKDIYMKDKICRWPHPYGRKQRGTKEPPDEGERGEWKSWLKTQHSKSKIMASGPITSWQIDGETKETVTDIIFLGSKITEDGDCRHGMKRRLLLGRKAMINLDSILKSRDITLPTKVCEVENMFFPKGKKSSFRIDFRKTKGNLSIYWKDWCWSWSSNTLATWWEELTH